MKKSRIIDHWPRTTHECEDLKTHSIVCHLHLKAASAVVILSRVSHLGQLTWIIVYFWHFCCWILIPSLDLVNKGVQLPSQTLPSFLGKSSWSATTTGSVADSCQYSEVSAVSISHNLSLFIINVTFLTEMFCIITFFHHKDYSLCFLKALGSTQSKSGARPPVRAATSLAVSPWLFLRLGSRSACERSNSTVSREFEARQARWSGVWPPLVTQLTGVLDSKSSATRTQFHLEAECKGVQPSSVVANGSAPLCRSNLTICRWLL